MHTPISDIPTLNCSFGAGRAQQAHGSDDKILEDAVGRFAGLAPVGSKIGDLVGILGGASILAEGTVKAGRGMSRLGACDSSCSRLGGVYGSCCGNTG